MCPILLIGRKAYDFVISKETSKLLAVYTLDLDTGKKAVVDRFINHPSGFVRNPKIMPDGNVLFFGNDTRLGQCCTMRDGTQTNTMYILDMETFAFNEVEMQLPLSVGNNERTLCVKEGIFMCAERFEAKSYFFHRDGSRKRCNLICMPRMEEQWSTILMPLPGSRIWIYSSEEIYQYEDDDLDPDMYYHAPMYQLESQIYDIKRNKCTAGPHITFTGEDDEEDNILDAFVI
jgi:hypothetical protein